MIWMMGMRYITFKFAFKSLKSLMYWYIFSFDFGNDEIQPLAYDSEGKPLNCGDLIPVIEEENGILFIY